MKHEQAVLRKQERFSPYTVANRGSCCSSADQCSLRSSSRGQPARLEQFWDCVVSVALGLCFKSVGTTVSALQAAQAACCSSGIDSATDSAASAALGEAEQLMARTIQLVQLTQGLVVEHAARKAGVAASGTSVPPATAAFIRRLHPLLAAKMAQHVAAAQHEQAAPQCPSDADDEEDEACSRWQQGSAGADDA